MNDKYINFDYLYPGRWMSYWYQLKEVSQLKGDSVLEIGPGNKIVTEILKKMGKKVTTLDYETSTEPDLIADISQPEININLKFQTILCGQVLEHIPYDKFKIALKNLYNLTDKNLVLTLPYTTKNTLCLKFYVPLLNKKIIKLFSPWPKEHVFNGQHYWEIGKKGYPLTKILKDIEQVGFKIVKNYPLFENPYHYLLVCQK